MAYGSFDLNRISGSSYLNFWAEWSSSSNGSDANSSYVTVNVYVYKSPNSTSRTYGTADTTVSVNGGVLSNNGFSFSVNPGASVLLFSNRFLVPHNDDGSMSTWIDISVGGTIMSASGGATVVLDTIPRAAKIKSWPSSFTDIDSPTIHFDNLAGGALEVQARISCPGASDISWRRIENPADTSYTFNFTQDELNILYAATNNDSTSRTVKFELATWIGNKFEYSTSDDVTFTITDCKPEINPTVIDLGSVSTTLTGDPTKMIRGYNIIQACINATLKKGAGIKYQSITSNGRTVNAGVADFPYTRDNVFTFSLTDTRGETVSDTITVPAIDYVSPTCTVEYETELIETEDVGTANTANVTITVSGNYFNGSFGAQNNEIKLKVKIGEQDSESLDWELVEPTFSEDNLSYTYVRRIENVDYKRTYVAQAAVSDKAMSEISTNEQIIKILPVFDWGKDDFNFNVPVTGLINESIPGYTMYHKLEQNDENDLNDWLNSVMDRMPNHSCVELNICCTPAISGAFYAAKLYKTSDDWAVLEGRSYSDNKRLYKCKYNGVWQAHEKHYNASDGPIELYNGRIGSDEIDSVIALNDDITKYRTVEVLYTANNWDHYIQSIRMRVGYQLGWHTGDSMGNILPTWTGEYIVFLFPSTNTIKVTNATNTCHIVGIYGWNW